MKKIFVASKVALRLLMVKRRVAVSPGTTGSPMNSLVNPSSATARSSTAPGEVAASPWTVAVTRLVALP